MSKPATRAEREYMDRVAALGCIACRKHGHHGTPAEIHHSRETAGMGQRGSNYDAIPLCPAHHRGTMHPHVTSIHLDRRVFIQTFGNEAALVEEVRLLLGERSAA